MNWITLTDIDQLDAIIDASKGRPQIIFKHSTRCSISSMAKRRLDKDQGSLDDFDSYYLDLISYRHISNSIAERLSVHHQSPQLIIVHNGEASYDESHLDISVSEILEHFKFLQN